MAMRMRDQAREHARMRRRHLRRRARAVARFVVAHGRRVASRRCRSTACSARSPALAARRRSRRRRARTRSLDRTITRPLRRQCRRRACPGPSRPMQREVEVKIGETLLGLLSRDQHLRRSRVTGTATFNVSPRAGGAPTSTRSSASASPSRRSQPGERLEMPVAFFVDPEIVEDRDARRHPRDHAVLHVLSRAKRRPEPAATTAGRQLR